MGTLGNISTTGGTAFYTPYGNDYIHIVKISPTEWGELYNIRFYARQASSSGATLWAHVWSSAGTDLAYKARSWSYPGLGGSWAWHTITLDTPVQLDPAETYYIGVAKSNSGDDIQSMYVSTGSNGGYDYSATGWNTTPKHLTLPLSSTNRYNCLYCNYNVIPEPPTPTPPVVGNTSSFEDEDRVAGTVSWSHTIPNNNNRILLLNIGSYKIYDINISNVKYAGENMTFLQYQDGGDGNIFTYYIIDPPVGTANISFYNNRVGTQDIFCTAIDLYNIDPNDPFYDYGTIKNPASATPSQSLSLDTNSVNQLVVAAASAGGNNAKTLQSPGIKEVEVICTSNNSNTCGSQAGEADGSTTIQFNTSGSSHWALSGVVLNNLDEGDGQGPNITINGITPGTIEGISWGDVISVEGIE